MGSYCLTGIVFLFSDDENVLKMVKVVILCYAYFTKIQIICE